jgi:hypothetical protein
MGEVSGVQAALLIAVICAIVSIVITVALVLLLRDRGDDPMLGQFGDFPHLPDVDR